MKQAASHRSRRFRPPATHARTDSTPSSGGPTAEPEGFRRLTPNFPERPASSRSPATGQAKLPVKFFKYAGNIPVHSSSPRFCRFRHRSHNSSRKTTVKTLLFITSGSSCRNRLCVFSESGSNCKNGGNRLSLRTGNPPDNCLFGERSVPVGGSGRVLRSSRPCRIGAAVSFRSPGRAGRAQRRIPVLICITKGRSDGRRSERTVATGPARARSACE
jgi:hypothetical protein